MILKMHLGNFMTWCEHDVAHCVAVCSDFVLGGCRSGCWLQCDAAHPPAVPGLAFGTTGAALPPARCLLSNQQNVLFEVNIDTQPCAD